MAKALTPVDDLRGALKQMEIQFKAVLPPHITPERFVRIVMTAVQGNPDLLNANRNSLFGACMKAAHDGLLPDGREAALVPFRSGGELQVQYMPMVWGIVKKVRNSGELANIDAQVVYENDEFDYYVDETGEHLKWRPLFDGDRGERWLTFAIARTKDGSFYIEVMSEKQVLDVKNASRAKNGPWSGPFEDEMWRKTAIRRLSKRLPMSTDVDEVLRRDEETVELQAAVAPRVEALPLPEPDTSASKGSSRLSKIVESRTAEAQG